MSYQPLLITGAPGRGQWSYAKRQAKAYLCDQENKPCGFCKSCQMFDDGTHPDLWLMVDDGDAISIDSARALQEFMHQKPSIANCRVVLIEHFDRATMAAQQSLLKMVEEPFVPTGIVFTARNIERVLPTMRSRMAIMPFKPMTIHAFKEWCQTEGVMYDEWLYDLTDGSPMILKGLDIAKLMSLKEGLEKGSQLSSFIDAFDKELFYAAVYHVLARRAKSTLAMKDFERVDAWQALYQEAGLSKSMNWGMQVKAFFLNAE